MYLSRFTQCWAILCQIARCIKHLLRSWGINYTTYTYPSAWNPQRNHQSQKKISGGKNRKKVQEDREVTPAEGDGFGRMRSIYTYTSKWNDTVSGEAWTGCRMKKGHATWKTENPNTQHSAQNDFQIHYRGCREGWKKKPTRGSLSGQNRKARLRNIGDTGAKRTEESN